ncbi:MAG: outer membrane lipoprotein-sorting protein [Acidobacteria bacterium]|nr:MAG: outer membrane lipoprotein-sorting protein [Acidobacteriota bacterium]
MAAWIQRICIRKKGDSNMKKIALLMCLVSSAFGLLGQDVNEIMKKAHLAAYYQGDDGVVQMLMKVYPKGGGKPIKKGFYMMKLDVEEGGKQMFFTYFVSPSDIKRTTFLVHKFIEKDDFRRLYIPASDKVIAIAGSRKQDPFMGSDFTYEDVSGRHFSKDNHQLLGEEEQGGVACYVTESVPKVKEDKIAKMKAWIDKATYTPMRVDFYNHDGVVYRSFVSSNVKEIQGFPTILKRVMTSPLKGTKTEILVNPKKTKYNVGLKEDVFTERSMKNPPMEFFK